MRRPPSATTRFRDENYVLIIASNRNSAPLAALCILDEAVFHPLVHHGHEKAFVGGLEPLKAHFISATHTHGGNSIVFI